MIPSVHLSNKMVRQLWGPRLPQLLQNQPSFSELCPLRCLEVRTRSAQPSGSRGFGAAQVCRTKALTSFKGCSSSQSPRCTGSAVALPITQQNKYYADSSFIKPLDERKVVLIIGSSIAGTVFALQLLTHPLLRARYKPILFDSAATLPYLENPKNESFTHPVGQSGAAIALTKQAMYPLRQLELGPELDDISQNTQRLAMYRQPFFGIQDGSQKGTSIIDWNAPPGSGVMGGLWTIQRGALQGLLIKNIVMRGGEIIPNKQLTTIIEHNHNGHQKAVEAVFNDSSSYRGDLLIGADGAWSIVRKHIYSQSRSSGEDGVDENWKPEFQNLHIMHGICRAETSDTKPTIYGMSFSGVGTGTWTLADKRQMWTIYEAPCAPPPNKPDSKAHSEEASKALSEKWDMDVFTGGYDQSSTEAFVERYRNVWHPSARTYGRLFDASEKVVRVGLWQKLFSRLGNVQWAPEEKRPKECGKDTGGNSDNGNIVLIGDAARVLLPTAGQGL